MAEQVGWQLVKDDDGSVINSWGGNWGQLASAPTRLFLPNGDIVEGASTGISYSGYTLVPLMMDEPAPTGSELDQERDRRVANNFVFTGTAFQLDSSSQQLITAAGASAKFALLAGAQAGNLRWADPDFDFGWIATDNSVMPMDAPTMSEFADAALVWVNSNYVTARALKDAGIPADYKDDKYWPTPSPLSQNLIEVIAEAAGITESAAEASGS